MDLEQLIEQSRSVNASDIHITENSVYKHRINGDIISTKFVVSTDEFVEFCKKYGIQYEDRLSYDSAITVRGIRMRSNFYHTNAGMKLALRLLSDTIPKLSDLNLAPSVKNIVGITKGLVLVTGITGSGKTTTLASLINEINQVRTDHIITIEDPIEYIFDENKCIISQREVGTHTPSFKQATIDAMREDPDIVMMGELRDLDTIQNAVTLAETGHLVLGTLHSRNAVESVDRMVDVFPAEQQVGIRKQICSVMACVISQSLIHREDGGRYCLQEVLYFNDSVRNLINQNKPINLVRATIPSSTNSVSVIDSAVRGIKECNADPYEAWAFMGLDDNEKEVFLRRCDAEGIPYDRVSQLDKLTTQEVLAMKSKEADIRKNNSIEQFNKGFTDSTHNSENSSFGGEWT